MDFQRAVEELLHAVDASRVTLRLDSPDAVFPVVAEADAPGVRSLRDAPEIDLRAAATFQELGRTLRPLVQDDCASAEVEVPQALMEAYGVKAQVLAPVLRDGELVGIVSVHENRRTRAWTGAEVATVLQTAADVQAALASR